MNEWIWARFIEHKAMVVVFVFLQTLSALSRDYYGLTSMAWTSYISSLAMVAEGVLTCCEGDILWKPRDPYQGSMQVTKLQQVKLISLLIPANINDCKPCPVHVVSDIFSILSYEILKFMFDPCRLTCGAMILRELKQMFYVVVLNLIVHLLYVVFSLRNHGKDNLLSPAERQTLNFCLFYF